MSTDFEEIDRSGGLPAWLPALSSVVALVGLADAIYLTVHHYTAEPVPCSVTNGCEQVLSSSYSELFGIPIAAFGAVAYFIAFSLALLSAFGNKSMWRLFGIHTLIMLLVSGWFIYVQAALIGAFCQYCLLSAGTSTTLFLLFLLSLLFRRPARLDP
ncbi:MAG: vitamin K epoxide reductase family protein [Acidobacteriota bacterium]